MSETLELMTEAVTELVAISAAMAAIWQLSKAL